MDSAYSLFYFIGMFVTTMIYYRLNINDYKMHPSWIKSECIQHTRFMYRLGLDYTYFDFSVLARASGCTFGLRFAKDYIDGYFSEETTIWKKIIRTSVGIALYIVLEYAFMAIPADNYLTDYAIRLFAGFVNSFIFFGLYPVA